MFLEPTINDINLPKHRINKAKKKVEIIDKIIHTIYVVHPKQTTSMKLL